MTHSRLAYMTVWVWAFLLLEADLKVNVHPKVHWGITALAFVVLLPWMLRTRFGFAHLIQWHVVTMAAVFAVSILATSLVTENALYGLVQALKLGIILLVVFPFLLTQPRLAAGGFRAAPAAVWANVALLLLGAAAGPVFAGVMAGDDRWGTFLNLPGSLWRLGVLVLVFSAYVIYWRGSFYYWMLVVASLALILADGSRTGFIVAMLAAVYVGFLSFVERRKRVATVVILGTVGCGGVMVAGAGLFGDEPGFNLLPLRFVGSARELVFGGLEGVDLERLQMLQVAWQRITDHPLWGSGIGTTLSETYEGPMVVHNAYLQVWADLGLPGLLAYTGLLWGWVLWFPRFISKVRRQGDPLLRGTYYNAAFLLFCFAISVLFNPLSTEWSEWIAFLVPYALYADALRQPGNGDEPTIQCCHNHA